jgi:uncharacterized membrane protein YeiB
MVITNIKEIDSRYFGLDLARGLAVLGMVFINFVSVIESANPAPGWLQWLYHGIRGRASVLFVILAGAGISLMSKRARLANNTELLTKFRKILWKRSLFLFSLGLLFSINWTADILHFYGAYLAFAAFFLGAREDKLWRMVLLAHLIFAVLFFTMDFNLSWNHETSLYPDFWSIKGMVRHLFFNGYYPFFPWIGFLFSGLWLGRQDLLDMEWLKKILKMFTILSVLGIVIFFILDFFSYYHPHHFSIKEKDFFQLGPMPPGPLYSLISLSSGIIIIVICQLVSLNGKWLRHLMPLVYTGQIALTVYSLHILLGMWLLEIISETQDPSDQLAGWVTLVFYLLSVVFAVLWRKRFEKGPVDFLMRKICG